MTQDISATQAASYRFWVREHVRFADLDLQGHVNNKAFTVYAERTRRVLREVGFWTVDSPRQNVIARVEIDYLRELHYPSDLRVGVRVLKVGGKSFTLGLGIFCGDDCAAAAVTVLARIDMRTRRAVELDAPERQRLALYHAAP